MTRGQYAADHESASVHRSKELNNDGDGKSATTVLVVTRCRDCQPWCAVMDGAAEERISAIGRSSEVVSVVLGKRARKVERQSAYRLKWVCWKNADEIRQVDGAVEMR